MNAVMYEFLKNGDTFTPMEAFEAGYIDHIGNITALGLDEMREWELD